MATAKLWEFRHRRCLDGTYPATAYPLPKGLLILLAALPFTAVAQQGSGPETGVESPRVLLSNADEAPAGWTETILAQGFITGHAVEGYRLGGVDLFLERPPSAVPGRPVVTLHADDMGEPGERVVVFTNPVSYAAGANRFAAPFPIVLNPRKAYHLLVNLGADPPLAFGLVFPGKADVASADARWVAQTGSRTLLDNWEWRFNGGFALRMALHEAGEDVSPPPPRLSATSAVAPVVEAADEAVPPPSPAEPDVVPAIAETSGSASVPAPTPEPAAPIQARATTQSRTTTAQPPTPGPQPEEEADDDEAVAPLPRSNRRTGLLIGAALAGLAAVSLSDDDDGPAPVETTPPEPPPPPLSDDATLSALAVSDNEGMAVSLTPMFTSAVTGYEASVIHDVATVTILPTTSHAEAEFEFLDATDMPVADADGGTADFQLNLVVGRTTVKVRVTAENGEAMQTYAVAIDRAMPPLSDNATLSALAVSDNQGTAVPLTPMFSSAVTGYEASVVHDVATVTLLPTTSHAEAEFEFLDATDMPVADADGGTADFQLNLVVGTTTVKIRVTAENGEAMQTYAVAIDRAMPPLSDDATLSALAVSDNQGTAVPLTPMFTWAVTGYEASVMHDVATVTLLPTTSHAEADFEFLDATDMSLADADGGAADFQLNLVVGRTTVKVRVTAENGEAMQTYAVAIDRAVPPLSDDATLSALAVGDNEGTAVSLTPTFSSTVTGYEASVMHDVPTVTLLPTTSHANAEFEFLDATDMPVADADGGTTDFQLNLVVGTTTVKVRVTAENGEAMQTYAVALNRAMPPLSDDATLSALAVSDNEGMAVSLTPMFSSTVTGYEASVAHTVVTVTLLPTTSHANADFEFLDANDMPLADADGGTADFQLNLVVGTTTVKVRVTAEDGEAMQTYAVAIDRAVPPLSDDATLSALAVSDNEGMAVSLTPTFSSTVTGYEASVMHDVPTVTLLPTTSHANADFEFLDASDMPLADADDGTADFQLNLVVGTTTVKVRVTAEDGEAMQTYAVTLDRALPPLSDDATLSALAVTDAARIAVPLTPTFVSEVTAYSASVENSVTTVTILPMKSRAGASVEFLDGMDMSLADADTGTADFQFDLDVGQNAVKVKVTAENGVAMQTYALTLTRAIAPPQQVLTLRVVPGPEALIPLWEASSDADGYRLQWKSGEEDYEQGGTREAIISDGATEVYVILDLLTGVEYTLRLIPTKVGAADGLPSNEATGIPYAPGVSVDPGSGGGVSTDGGGSTGGGVSTEGGRDSEPEAWLADLEVTDPNGDEVTLTPPFSTPTASYSASVANEVDWVTFKPTKNDPASVVVYEDGANQRLNDANGNSADFQVNLNEGLNTVRVRVSHPEAQSQGTYTFTITRAALNVNENNNAPTFSGSTLTRSFDEDVGDGVRGGADVGGPITADDVDLDPLTYSLSGPDEALFLIHADGQICTRPGINYDRESRSSYSITVRVDDGSGGSDTVAVTINVNDVEEPPVAPDAPTVSAVPSSATRLKVTWTPPDNTGRPAISSYDLQYSEPNDQSWTDGPQNLTGTSATIADLDPSTEYLVQVRATNSDGDGPWSDPGIATTADPPPQIDSNATRSFDEDVGDGTRTGVDVGAPVTASNHGANHSYSLSGTDAGSFSIGSSTGQIRTLSGTNYDHEAQSSYSVIVDSNDGNSGTEAILLTINVNDVTEKPTKPAVPTVENLAGNTRVLFVTWTAPSNIGRPPIASYDLQYREAPSGPWFNGPQNETGLTATIRNLSPSTEYDVQVRATNADGDGPWSDDGSATTSAALPETCASTENGNTRLADGFTVKEGRVEICAEDPDTSGQYIWGAICDDYWTDDDAKVVCKQQGYFDSEPIGGRFLRAYFGASALDFLLDDMTCAGTESNLLQCMVHGGALASTVIGEHNCDANEAVGVRCLTESEYNQHVLEIPPDQNNQSAMLSIADVDVYEAAGTTMDFVVTLSGTATGTVSVNYETVNGTAKAGVDYIAKSGMVTFPLGTTSRTIRITVLDDLVDEHDEQGERMTVRLSNAIGARILDSVAYGTIENSDPLPQAWLTRFGRVAADQAVEAIGSRMFEQQGARESELTVAGHRLDLSGDVDPAAARHAAAMMAPRAYGGYGWPSGGRGSAGFGRPGAPGSAYGGFGGIGSGFAGGAGAGAGLASGAGVGLTGGFGAGRSFGYGGTNAYGLLAGSSFRWALGADGGLDADSGRAGGREPGAIWTAWGSGAATRFSGLEDELTLHGDVASATLGLDRELGPWLTGVALAFSVGEGAFAPTGEAADLSAADGGIAGGLIETTLTTLYPYARYAVNDRLSVWGMLGYGQGDLSLVEERAGTRYDTDTGMVMGAFGARGVILDRNGFELALRTDAMQVRMDSDSAPGLASSTGDTGRIRALLEGSRTFTLGTGRTLQPTVEFGLRNDTGDAETGSGIELGLGVRYADSALGLSVEARARGLVSHQDSSYEEWGAWATIRLDPGDDGRGFSLSLSPTWGVAGSGLNQLWNSGYGRGYGRGYGDAPGTPFDAGGRLTAELGYAVGAFHGQGLGTWYLGLDRAGQDAQRWRLGRRWQLGTQLQMSVEGARNEYWLLDPDHTISVGGLVIW